MRRCAHHHPSRRGDHALPYHAPPPQSPLPARLQDQVLQRSFTQERLTAVAASRDGAYLAGGGASGSLYLWELGSGRLLRAWPAHYKASAGGVGPSLA